MRFSLNFVGIAGAVPIFSFPKILIDISAVQEIKGYYFDQNLVIGAGTSLTNLMEIFSTVAKERTEFAYLQKLYEHLDLVAHIPVRNVSKLLNLHTYIPLTLYPRRGSRGISDIPLRHPPFIKIPEL
jgi:hypothetical protein